MRLLIVGENQIERKSLEHLLISSGEDNFHSVEPNEELHLYLDKIIYKFVIIISKTLSKVEILNLSERFSKSTIFISISQHAEPLDNIISFDISGNYKEKLLDFLNSYRRTVIPPKEDILIKINDRYKRIRLEDIEYIKADGKYVTIHLSNRHYSLRSSLKGIALMLPDYFIRTHSSFIVNINMIESIHIIEQNIELLNSNIPFSRKYKVDLLKRFHLG